jgi:anti-anti-sigma factor
MKYEIVQEKGLVLIKISGHTRHNEALVAKRVLFPHLRKAGLRVIVDLKALRGFELVSLLGVLNGLRKKVDLMKGNMTLCSLEPDTLKYFEENRLDHVFRLFENQEEARKEARRTHER